MTNARFTMTSGKVMVFENLQATISYLGEQCSQNTNILVRGSNGKDILLVGRHVESIEEL